MAVDAGPTTTSTRSGVPAPPDPFPTDINIIETDVGLILHRVHATEFRGNAFNPSAVKRNRFSPIRDAEGKIVSVLYAGHTVACAFYETLFHDKVISGALAHLNTSDLTDRRYGSYAMNRKLRLAALFAPDLARLDLTLDQLTHCGPSHYGDTARWAEAIHRTYPDVDGLAWTSYRGDPDCAYVLFGDRVAQAALLPKREGEEILESPELLQVLLTCARRLGVRVHLSGV